MTKEKDTTVSTGDTKKTITDQGSFKYNHTPVDQTQPKKKKGGKLAIILGAILVLLVLCVGVAGALGWYIIDQTKKRNDYLSEMKESIEESGNDVEKLAKHMIEDDNLDPKDSGSYLRQGEETKEKMQKAQEGLDKIKGMKDDFDNEDVKQFKNLVDKYIDESNDLIEMSKDYEIYVLGYVEPVEKIAQMDRDFSTNYTYIYSDTDKFVEEIDKVIVLQKEVIEKLKTLKFKNEKIQSMNDKILMVHESRLRFYEGVKKGAQEKDQESIIEVQKEHTTEVTEIQKELNEITDELNDYTEKMYDDVREVYDEVREEYNELV